VRLVDCTRRMLWLCGAAFCLTMYAPPDFAQTVQLIPSCGAPASQFCISGSGWAEPNPLCRYIFTMDGTSVAADQQDGLYGPPATNATVPPLASGNHTVLVQLVLDDTSNALIQQQTAPFLIVTPNTAGTVTTATAGDTITLTYTPPNPSCPSTCTAIYWIQVVQRFVRLQGQANPQPNATSVTDWPNFPDAAQKAADQTATNTRVDRIWGRNYPYYGVNNDGGASGTIQVGMTGAPPTAATMEDGPNTPAPFFPTTLNGSPVTVAEAILRFESTPFCAAGDQAGQYLGQTVTWESHQTPGGAATIQNVATHMGQPSANYSSAVTQWVSGNPPGTGTNRPAFNLPQPMMSPCIY
jgi:hypothetical protein